MNFGAPGQVTTTVTVATENTSVNRIIRYDHSFVKTIPGILKIVQVVLNLIGFICIMSSGYSYNSRVNWFNTVAMAGFCFSLICLILYMFHVIEKFYKIPWLKIELGTYSLWTFCYLIAASLIADIARYHKAFAAAAFFGYCAMIAYGYDAWLKYKCIKTGCVAQG